MGNYLAKIKSVFSLASLTNSENKSRGRKRKRSCLRHSHQTNELREAVEDEVDTNSSNLDDDEESEIEEELSNDEDELNVSTDQQQSEYFDFFTNLSRQNFNSRLQNSPLASSTSSLKPAQSAKSLLNTVNNCKKRNKLTRPNKKKNRSTTDYIYETLYLKGEGSDLVVRALDKHWQLHKIYLRQSPYFNSMFKNGSIWKESAQTKLDIQIPDANITAKSLFLTFGSFYREEIEIAPVDAIGVLACASLFGLDDLLNNCVSIMIENIDFTNCVDFYNASLLYSVSAVTEAVFRWFGANLMINTNIKLNEISLELFEKILSLSSLMIIQVETDLYSLCKNWLYLKLSNESKLEKNWQKSGDKFFRTLLSSINDSGIEIEENDVNKERPTTLLTLSEYSQYVKIFKKIRFQHILTDLASLNIIYSDRIIPHEWIEPFYFKNWLNLLYMDHDFISSTSEFQIDKKQFDEECARFGRVLNEDNNINWRWVGFNYGIDLLISHSNRTFTLKRNASHLTSPYRGLLSNRPTQRIFYTMKAVKFDKYGNEKWCQQTELTLIDLSRNEEKFILKIDHRVKYPIYLNFRVLTHPLYASNNFLIRN